MTTRLLLALTAATFMASQTVTIATLLASAKSAQEEAQEERANASAAGAVLTLDAAIQQRFTKVNGTFGYTRIMPKGSAHGFEPESDAELSSLSGLDEAHLRVALYLAGRRLLRTGQNESLFVRSADRIKGPARITQGPFPAMPAPESLWDDGRRAFTAFDRDEPQYEFAVRDWNVIARPVRASSETCLQCHRKDGQDWPALPTSDMRVGDVIGVVLYAYHQR